MEQGNKSASNSGQSNNPGQKSASGGNSGNKRRSNNRRRNNRKKPSGQQAQGQDKNKQAKAGQPQGEGPKKRPNNRRRRPNNRNRKPQAQNLKGEDFVIVKYLNLLEQHIVARRKYFDNFERVGEKQLEKLERNYIETQKTFLAFKERLKEEDLKIFEEKFESLKMDETYSNNHELPKGEVEPEVEEDQIEDPHYLQTQIQSNFSEDTEESVGTLDDYKAYKGL